jgi:hypothetical protein
MPYFKMPDGTWEEGANQAAASRTYNARRAGLTVRQNVPVTIERLPVQQQITPRANEPVNLQILEQGKPIRPTVAGPVSLQRANVVQAKQSVVSPPVQPVIVPLELELVDNRLRPIRRPVRVLPGQPIKLPEPLQRIEIGGHQAVLQPAALPPAIQALPPLVIVPSDSIVRPTRYVYVPGLARDAFVARPCKDLKEFKERIRTVFGYLDKRVHNGQVSPNMTHPDIFMTGAVGALCRSGGTTPVNCGRALRWVLLSTGDRQTYKSKAFKRLGAPQENLVGLKPGMPKPPKELEYDGDHTAQCLAAEYMAQPKRMTPAPKIGNQPEKIEPKALSGLQPDDILYIVGHGNQRGGTLTYKVAPLSSHPVRDEAIDADQPGKCKEREHLERWYVDPLTLAALLVDDGLPITHKNIEMVMCYGAGMSLAKEQTVQSFCGRLAGALGAYGYKKIKVRGTVGLVMSDLSVNPSLTPRADGKLTINTGDEHEVKPTDPRHGKLFRTFKAG